MSTLMYSALTAKRKTAAENTSTTTSPPGVKTYVDAVAALVPAEVLALHAVIMATGATKTTKDPMTGEPVTTIVEPTTLKWTFVALIVITPILYVIGLVVQKKRLQPWDAARAALPALALVAWTMLQKATVFDAVAPDLRVFPRTVIALFGAVVIGAVAGLLGMKLDKEPPS